MFDSSAFDSNAAYRRWMFDSDALDRKAAEEPARLPWPLAMLIIGALSLGLWIGIFRLAAALF